MWDGSLGEIKATDNWLTLKPGAKPHREMTRWIGPGLCARIEEEIQKIVHAEFIQPATS